MKKYVGELKLVGAGRKEMQYGVTGYSVLEIGDSILKKINANELIATYLEPGEELELYIGPLFFSRYIYALRRQDGRLVKMGIGLFMLSLAIKIVFLLLSFGVLIMAGAGPGGALILVAITSFFLFRSMVSYVRLR